MKFSTYLRWITAWWIAAAAILVFGAFAKAQTFGSPQTVITAYRYLNITGQATTNTCLTYDVNFTTGLTIVTATANSDITVSYF